jgi:hypothetical protein
MLLYLFFVALKSSSFIISLVVKSYTVTVFLQKYKLHLVTCKMFLSYWNEHLMIELEPDLNSQNIVLQREIPTLKVYLQSGVHLNTIHSFLCLFFFAKVNNSQIVQ